MRVILLSLAIFCKTLQRVIRHLIQVLGSTSCCGNAFRRDDIALSADNDLTSIRIGNDVSKDTRIRWLAAGVYRE